MIDPLLVSGSLSETVLQFGTGRFLRAFVDLFIEEMNRKSRPVGRVVVVQSTGSRRAQLLNQQEGRYHVAIRGLQGAERVDRVVDVASIGRALRAQTDWDQVLEVGRSKSLCTIVSNTTEAGYRLDPEDVSGDHPPVSFPFKLMQVLSARFEAGLPGVDILPCELIEENGIRLRELVLALARRWEPLEAFAVWLVEECRWWETLVDRIVSAPTAEDPLSQQDPLLAVCEPYALWLIAGGSHGPSLAGHPSVEKVDSLGPYHLRKVRILNGAHTALVSKALPLGIETVRQAVEDEQIRPWVESLLFDEIVPTLEGRIEQPERFARQALERFGNPFLEHRLVDIALAHEAKIETRLAPTQAEYIRRFGKRPVILDTILASSGRSNK